MPRIIIIPRLKNRDNYRNFAFVSQEIELKIDSVSDLNSLLLLIAKQEQVSFWLRAR